MLPSNKKRPSVARAPRPVPAAAARALKRRPCRECRSVKTKCEWDDAPEDPRCLRCREKGRRCQQLPDPVGSGDTAPQEEPSEDSADRTVANRRAKWACIECKKRKRACVGGRPVFLAADDQAPQLNEDGTVADPAMDAVTMTPCDFCTRNRLECRWPLLSGSGETVLASTAPSPVIAPTAIGSVSRALATSNGVSLGNMENEDPKMRDVRILDSAVGLNFMPNSATFTEPTGGTHALAVAGAGNANQVLAARYFGTSVMDTGFGGQAPLSPIGFAPGISYDQLRGVPGLGFWTSPMPTPMAGGSANSPILTVPRPLSAFEAAQTLPSTDCLYWLLGCFWTFHGEMGRSVPIHRAKFLRSAWTPEGESSPLLWILLWGTTVFLDSPINRYRWGHPELTASAKAAIRERARAALVAGLQIATSDLAALETTDVEMPPAFLSRIAQRLMPVLQSLILGMLFYERAGGNRNMIALVSLVIKLGALSSQALKPWITRVTALVNDDRPPEARSPREELSEVDRWIESRSLEPPFPHQYSLLASMKTPSLLTTLAYQDQEDIVLLAEYAACFFFAYGVDAWAADILGIPLNMSSDDVGHVPVPFDGRHFEHGEESSNPYLGAGQFARLQAHVPDPFRIVGLHIVPVVAMENAHTWVSSSATPEQRRAALAGTITDCFRVGPFFVASALYEIERKIINLRLHARLLGFPTLYPHGALGSPEIALEYQHIKTLQRELFAAIPKEIHECVQSGNVETLFDATISCPQWVPSLSFVGAYIWLYDSMAGICTPPPDSEPEDGWYLSEDGIVAAKNAILAARLIQNLLNFGYDVNNGHLLSWFHTKIDRITRILFLHLQNAQKFGLQTAQVFQSSMLSCLTWFQGLGRGERYAEWLDRLAQADLHISKQSRLEEEQVSEEATLVSRMVISSEDKALGQFREEMTSIDTAVQSLV